MKYLLDTHTFLWWALEDTLLSQTARELMEDPENTIYFSTASSWEISIKVRLGKLVLPVAPEIFIPDCIGVDHFTVLPIGLYHSLEVVSLPMMHNDPFDRMLIAQSRVENIPILTADARIKEYDINVVW